jgi:alkylhydroperoxidase family enzyme
VCVFSDLDIFQKPITKGNSMSKYTVHTIQSAPEAAKPIMEFLQQRIGFVPNLAATMAGSPSVLEAYAGISGSFGKSSLNAVERELIAMTTAYEYGADYPMAIHSTFARGQGSSEADLEAIRAGKNPADSHLAALIQLTRQLVRKHGQLSDEDVRDFVKAGFTEGQILEVLIGITQTTLATLVARVAGTKLDEGFQALKWEKSA